MGSTTRGEPPFRLGDLLVQRGLITREALRHALAVQRAAAERACRPPRIGEILVNTGLVRLSAVREALEDQRIARGQKRLLRMRVEAVNGVLLLRLHGRLDRRTDQRLATILERSLDEGMVRIALDARRLLAVDNFGLSSFVVFLDEVRLRGGDIKVFGLNPRVRADFSRMGLTEHIDILAHESEAIEAFREDRAAAASPGLAEYVSAGADRCYHLSFCPQVRRFRESTRRYYRTCHHAERAGLRRCPKCLP